MWTSADSYVEVWLEKDALSGVVTPVTAKYDVPLMVAKGCASLSFLSEAAEYMELEDRPVYVYHLGDFDLSGVNAGHKIEQTLRQLAPHAEIHFNRLAVTPEQIAAWNLPSRPTKQSDSRAKGFMTDAARICGTILRNIRGFQRISSKAYRGDMFLPAVHLVPGERST